MSTEIETLHSTEATTIPKYKTVVVQDDATEVVQFCNQDWRVFWPKHSRNRAYDRHSHPKAAKSILRYLLKQLEPMVDTFWDEFTSEVTIRAFPLKSCFVLKVDKIARNICVATYGECSEFNPRYGDTVITLATNGNVSVNHWQKLTHGSTNANDKKLIGYVVYANE